MIKPIYNIEYRAMTGKDGKDYIEVSEKDFFLLRDTVNELIQVVNGLSSLEKMRAETLAAQFRNAGENH